MGEGWRRPQPCYQPGGRALYEALYGPLCRTYSNDPKGVEPKASRETGVSSPSIPPFEPESFPSKVIQKARWIGTESDPREAA